MLALGVAQGGAPAERRPPVTSLTRPTASVTPPRRPAAVPPACPGGRARGEDSPVNDSTESRPEQPERPDPSETPEILERDGSAEARTEPLRGLPLNAPDPRGGAWTPPHGPPPYSAPQPTRPLGPMDGAGHQGPQAYAPWGEPRPYGPPPTAAPRPGLRLDLARGRRPGPGHRPARRRPRRRGLRPLGLQRLRPRRRRPLRWDHPLRGPAADRQRLGRRGGPGAAAQHRPDRGRVRRPGGRRDRLRLRARQRGPRRHQQPRGRERGRGRRPDRGRRHRRQPLLRRARRAAARSTTSRSSTSRTPRTCGPPRWAPPRRSTSATAWSPSARRSGSAPP